MIVDDHPMVRDGLRVFLLVYSDLELVGEAGNGEEALELCERLQPDVILMDLKMPSLDGIETTKAVRKRFPGVRVLALTSYADEKLIQETIQAGAIGYLLKDVPADELAEAIRAAYAGQVTMSPAVTEALVQATSQSPKLGHDLTKREREVLALLIEGLSNARIADMLQIRPSTVNYHVSNILSKLSVSNRTEAARLAMQNKIV
jgi:NarL family two-component system response regulator LiaR